VVYGVAPVFCERTSVGLDVHARSVVAAAIDGQTGEVFRARAEHGPAVTNPRISASTPRRETTRCTRPGPHGHHPSVLPPRPEHGDVLTGIKAKPSGWPHGQP